MTDETFAKMKDWIAEVCTEMNGNIVSLDTGIMNAYAFVFLEATAIGIDRKIGHKPTTYGVEARPIIIGDSNFLQKHEARSNLYHELIHVQQFLEGKQSVYYPGVNRIWTTRRREIEAYSHQAIAEEAYYGVAIEENPYHWNSMAVEAIRRKLNTDRDPYRVSKK